MVKERYVNIEVAKLLRDKGFDEECIKTYNISNGQMYIGGETCNSEFTDIEEIVTTPTQQMACDWLIENYKIYINVSFVSGKGYVGTICDISDFDNAFSIVETKYYSCIETVYNEALKYVLTNLV